MHKQLFADFTRFSYRLSCTDAFDAIVNSILYPVCIRAHEDFTIKEPVTAYSLTENECRQLQSILKQIGDLMEKGEEPLGDLFMEFVSKGHNGQYFTPMHICNFMNQLLNADDKTSDEAPRVHDPACGSGRMLLAAAVEHKSIHCYGTDIDDRCCRMAAANMILHNLVADITCGDELSMRFSHGYLVRRSLVFNFPTLQIVKYVAAEKTAPQPEKLILPDPKSRQEKWTQSSLF